MGEHVEVERKFLVKHPISGWRRQTHSRIMQGYFPLKTKKTEIRLRRKVALVTLQPEEFHEWRKQVKQLAYQLGLLCPIWPEQLQASEHELKKLGQYLGDDHDLFMLKEAIQGKCAASVSAGELELLSGLVDQRQNELRSAAMALGTRFYSERPSAFYQRLGRYWNIWCRRTARVAGKKQKVGKLGK